jgi:sugar lactone lactonase YvrE
VKRINFIFRTFLAAIFPLMALLPAAAHPPTSVVMDSKGNVYYSDLEQVWKISPAGKLSVAVANVHTHELYLDKLDRLYGEDVEYLGEKVDKYRHRVWRLSPSGTLTDIIPEREGFPEGYGFTYDGTGNMYWLDQSPDRALRKRTPSGKETIIAGGNFKYANWLTATPDGTIYLVSEGNLLRISPGKAPVTVAKHLHAKDARLPERHYFMGMWNDKSGNIYIAASGEKKVKRITPNGKVSSPVRSGGNWFPTGGLTAPDGSLWVLECSPENKMRVSHVISKKNIKIYGAP